MINIINNKQAMTFLTTKTIVLLISTVVIWGNSFISHTALAQKTNSSSIETFSAKGYTGQTFVLPSQMMLKPPDSIVFSLLKGKLVNLSIDPAKTEGLFSTPLFAIVTSLY